MKKFTLALMALLALTFTVKAQQYVSTEPSNRNVILEEFTGRGCGYCTDGHRIANQIMAASPGRVWAINIHAGGYAQTSYPNMITTDGNTIHGGFSISGYPTGVVNRTTAAGIDRGQWSGQASTQMNQASECNIAGIATVNPDTRVATITVEVYYTGNSTVDENYLTVAMLQDSILGSQSDYGNYNPTQWLNGQYVHMHILRDVVSSSAWGDPISPTTQGTLITRTYEYPIPETIGSPNGVVVDLNNIFFLAWVSERQQGNAYRPILTGCELEKTTMTNEPIYPMMSSISQTVGASCSHTQTFNFSLSNIGLNELTSIHFTAEAGDVTESFEWNGSLPSGDKTNVEFTMDLPFGNFEAMLNIEEVNGEPYEAHKAFDAECSEWVDLAVEGETTLLKLIIVTDQFGEQTTWDVTNSAGEVIASGGPYNHMTGSIGTTPHSEIVDNLPVNDCYMFRIYDSNSNGICCNYGNGYYQIKDANNNIIVNGDGSFGAEGKHLISITNPNAVTVATVEPRILGDHEVMFIGTIEGASNEVGFEYKKLVSPTPMTVMGELNGSTFTATVDDMEAGTMYSVKAFAIVGGNKVYGQSIDFHTWYEGVSELENTLKVYPNPAKETLTVEGTMTAIAVYNTVGQCLLTKEVNGNTQIDLSSLNNGIYFLRVYNNGEVAVRKFSVNR